MQPLSAGKKIWRKRLQEASGHRSYEDSASSYAEQRTPPPDKGPSYLQKRHWLLSRLSPPANRGRTAAPRDESGAPRSSPEKDPGASSPGSPPLGAGVSLTIPPNVAPATPWGVSAGGKVLTVTWTIWASIKARSKPGPSLSRPVGAMNGWVPSLTQPVGLG
jgi:hypothetical protein